MTSCNYENMQIWRFDRMTSNLFKIIHKFQSSNKLQIIHKSQYNPLLLHHKHKFKFVYYFELIRHKCIILLAYTAKAVCCSVLQCVAVCCSVL